MKLYALIISSLLSVSIFAADIIKVGVYDFPPYAYIEENTTGITVQMIAAMNKFQNKYQFVAVPTTARRRYLDFENNKFDMLIFENKKWGWEKYPVTASKTFVTGSEVYVAKAKAGRGQEFFSDFKNKAMIGVFGYHYKFSGFSNDQDYLKKKYKLLQTTSQKKSLELILNGRGDIAVLSKEYLNYHFLHSPADEGKLVVSDIYDQIYQHSILVRKNHKLSVKHINQLLDQMQKSQILQPLWEKYGLRATP
ncbi:ABC transporter substrate-binding protein [Colwellia sp. KU-HH00111]|uniref:substrate-binding periplasmic protein n=1 Tax=Colwellia sp. KU-HH00111 TaxID=3127652 RepID=UPI00310734B3